MVEADLVRDRKETDTFMPGNWKNWTTNVGTLNLIKNYGKEKIQLKISLLLTIKQFP